MNYIEGIILGILQGALEWLPVSSEGQITLLLILVFEIDLVEALALAILLHLGTALVVLIRYRIDFIEMANRDSELLKTIFLVTLGTALTAIPILLVVEDLWSQLEAFLPISPGNLSMILVGTFLIVTGVVLWSQREDGNNNFTGLTTQEAILLGMAQGIAVLPGISRSGITISVLLYLGMRKSEALRGSFLVSVPSVLGAMVWELLLGNITMKSGVIVVGSSIFSIPLLLVTLGTVFLAGWLSMDALLRLAQQISFSKFCLLLGIVSIGFAIVP